MVHDHLNSKNLKAHTIPITKEMVKSVRGAHQKYIKSLEDASKKKKESTNGLKRKIISDELDEIQKKKISLGDSIQGLVKDADELSIKAQEKLDFKLLERSNDLRKIAESKKVEIKELDKMANELHLRRDSIV